ncbi:Os04g0202600 [Oryza sativa Japonica Group]|uniref:Os04g0202600 protein n=1 Tax=Oryza sativa subsp. japonica TaxID=39947 RepID=A0A0P0W756_ORYSJ|nr:Os04g0202600 [Oryza sativa Japonica Group]
MVWKPLTIDENVVMRISCKSRRSRHDALVATTISQHEAVSATLVGEVIPLSVSSGCPHILCLSHKTLGNAPETYCCRAQTTMQQMTGRGYLYGAISECPIITGNARAMAKVRVVNNAKTMTEATYRTNA